MDATEIMVQEAAGAIALAIREGCSEIAEAVERLSNDGHVPMTKEEAQLHARQLLSIASGVSRERLDEGKLTKDELARLELVGAEISKLPLYVK